ncbi:hypothetical protein AVEN_17505-1, partial [Araneus ventricosus]
AHLSSRTETPPSDASPQTPPAAPSSSPSRRNSDRRKRGFVRKNTQSAPDSFDNDDDSYSEVPTITHSSADTTDGSTKRNEGLSIGYFNFDSMQRLLDLSITASTKPEKPAFLLTPGDVSVAMDIFFFRRCLTYSCGGLLESSMPKARCFNPLTPKTAVTGHTTSILVEQISACYCSESGEKVVGLGEEIRDERPSIDIFHHP